MTTPALCQCTVCLRYLAKNRFEGSFEVCEECAPNYVTRGGTRGGHMPGIPLADIRGPESLPPAHVELLGLLAEECGETLQRIGKILRWGWSADFGGTTQRHKLETELGDVLVALTLMLHEGLIDTGGLLLAARDKLGKLHEDRGTDEAPGPRQRLKHAHVPEPTRGGFTCLAWARHDQDPTAVVHRAIKQLAQIYCFCGRPRAPGFKDCDQADCAGRRA